MESALTPREIQARIRSGESVAEVAAAAGVPVDRIDVYAGPVLAEREHAALLARTSQVRRRGESSAHRLLGEVVADALAQEVEADQIRWDAWRSEDRRWVVRASWASDDQEHQAHFDFDPRGRYSTAGDDAGRKLIAEPRSRTTHRDDPDAEPTVDLNDELAIVRVVQDDSEPPAVLPDAPAARIIKLPGTPNPSADGEPDDYSPAELEQVDGIYDIIPNPHGDMDVLYDMLSGFNEDSVRIYAGLTQPVSPAPAPEAEESVASRPRSTRRRRSSVPPAAPTPEPVAAQQPDPQPETTVQPTPEQDALVAEPEPVPTPAPAKTRRKRASVPTWDEIMFGGPTGPK